MSHRTTGLTFIAIGAFLYAMKYLAAATLMTGSLHFELGLEAVDEHPLPVLAILSTLLGGGILFRVESKQVSERKPPSDEIKEEG